jgi:hypothetical protein
MEPKETSHNSNEIISRLARLQTDVNFVKEYIEDISLSKDDLIAIKEAKQDLHTGKTRRL